MPASVGRTVLFVLHGHIPGIKPHAIGQVRPAIVVRTWGENGGPSETVNLQVLLDGDNDTVGGVHTAWVTSARHEPTGQVHCTWHWPQRV